MVDGLSIISSQVSQDAVQLTLSNNAVITLFGASSFNFDIGGNALVGPGEIQDFTTFVTTTLGIDAVPESGTVSGGPVVIGEAADPRNIIDLVEGSSDPVDATVDADVFTFDAAVALADVDGTNTQIDINGFDTTADSMAFDLTAALGETTLDQLDGVEGISVQLDPFEGDLVVNFGNDANGGDLVVLNLVGVADAGQVNVDIV